MLYAPNKPIIFGEAAADAKTYKPVNHLLLYQPYPAAYLVCGATGTGKSTIACHMITPNGAGMDWNKLFVFSPSISQPKFVELKEALEEAGKRRKKPFDAVFTSDFSLIEGGTLLKRLDTYQKNKPAGKRDHIVVLFDDIITAEDLPKKVRAAAASFCRNGRPIGISTIYTAQKWVEVPTTVRSLAKTFLFTKGCFDSLIQCKANWSRLCSEVHPETFWEMAQDAYREDKRSYIVLDKETTHPFLKLRVGLWQKFLTQVPEAWFP